VLSYAQRHEGVQGRGGTAPNTFWVLISRADLDALRCKKRKLACPYWKFNPDSSVIRICSCNLRTFFSILAAEKSGCVICAHFFLFWQLKNWGA